MKYLDFEKHIKNELQDSKEAVHMDALLASLNLGKNQPKRKGFALWMILPFLLLTVSFAAWQVIELDNKVESDAYLLQKASKVQSSEKEILIGENENNEINYNGATFSNQDNQDNNENISNEEEISSKATKTQTLENNTIQTFSKNTVNSKNISLEITKSFYEKHSLKNNQSVEPAKVSSLNTSYIYKQDSQGSTLNTKIEGKKFSAVELEPKSSRALLSIADLDNSLETLNKSDVDGHLFSRMKINCPSFDNLGWHMALIPEVGIFKPIKTLENKSPEESEAFNERIKSESTLEGLEIGLYGMLVRDNVPLYLKAGVSYSRISERMELKYEYTKLDTTIGIISSTVSSNGDTITHIYGDIVTETTFKGSNRQHHYIHLFDIPISLGYTTYVAGLDIGIEAGVKVNFMTRATGNLLTSQNEYTNLALNKLFKKSIGLSYFGGLMIGRNFGRYGDFYIAPRFTYFPNSFDNQNNSISQKYFNIGLNAGFVHKIN